jgi:hypothetical protein
MSFGRRATRLTACAPFVGAVTATNTATAQPASAPGTDTVYLKSGGNLASPCATHR